MGARDDEARERVTARRRVAAIQATAEEEWWRSVKATVASRREAGLRSSKWRPGRLEPSPARAPERS
jgi:hypothetical protein